VERVALTRAVPGAVSTLRQGLTLVHYSPQRKHILRDSYGGFGDKMAQVEPKSGRVSAPALRWTFRHGEARHALEVGVDPRWVGRCRLTLRNRPVRYIASHAER
jgi:hypothetical protein